jgi:hypothetical protein
MKFSYFLLALCLLILILPVSAGTAQQSWYNDTEGGGCVTAVDSNSAGTLVIAGYWNGNITAYTMTVNTTDNNVSAVVAWRNRTNNTGATNTRNAIRKIVADSSGNIVWMNDRNETGYISSTGAVGSKINSTTQNISDIALRADGGMYAATYLRSGTTPSKIVIYNTDGSIYAQNTSFGTSANWTNVGFDPNNQWIITSNQSHNRLYYWNITSWTGWEEFNPTHTASKNLSQQFIDSFPYRESINITASASTKGIIFVNNTTNTSTVLKINDTLYQYNRINIGTYFWWQRTGNLSNATNVSEQPQNGLLNLSYVNGNYYYVVFRPITGVTNYTFYMGNGTLNNSVTNQTWTNNGTLFRQNISASATWNVPARVEAVNLTMYGGGGGGQTGSTAHPGVRTGTGGTAAALTQQNNVIVTPGGTATITIGNGGAANTIGGTTTFNNGTNSYTATGGATGSGYTGAPGGAGNTSIPSYPTATTGGTGFDEDWNCVGSNYNPGSAGGAGYGAGGGGGGGYYDYNCGYYYPGAGGAGAAGIIQISYYINDVPVYYYGATPTTTLHSFEVRQTSNAINQTSVQDYVGTIVGLSVPSNGGLASIITDTIFYQQYISSSGFGSYYCATLSTGGYALFAGTPHDVKASNSGTASIEGRGSYGNIYDSGAVARASSLTGNTIRSVDSAMSSGLFAAFGGDEGKIYMLSKEGASSWYSYYTGGIASPIQAVAVGWNGECVILGRGDGRFEYYVTNVSIAPVPTTAYADAQLRVYKDGSAYASQPVTIYSSSVTPYVWTPIGTSYTDGGGTLTYTTTTGVYYKFVVNNVPGTTNGEGEVIWQSNTASTVVQIFILSASTPYEWNAYYNTASNNVTVMYSDKITPTSVVVTIKDLKTNLDVLTRVYYSTPSFVLEYRDQSGTGSYQVTVLINRMGNAIVRDQRIVTSPNAYGTILPNDQYITWAISTFVLMLIAGMFSYSNSKRGALAVVVIAVLMMWFKLLPMSMMTVAMLAAIFAVMSLFASRVQ